MRFSIIKGDQGYDPKHERRVKSVTLNGRDMVGVVTADEEAGFILALTLDPMTGEWMRDPISGEYTLSRESGKVVVTLVEQEALAWDTSRKVQTKVRVGRDPGSKDILVQVYSNARPNAIKQGRMEYLGLPISHASICQKAGAAAGALAEMLVEQFGDRFDPSHVAAEAVRQCALMLHGER